MSLFLTVDELHRLTGKRRYTAQRRVLDARGIRYVTAATGEPLVRPEALDGPSTQPRYNGPRWDRITQ